MMPNEAGLQHRVRHRAQQQVHAIQYRRPAFEVVLAHPSRGERKQRQPEQQVQIRPQYRPVDGRGQLEHVVVVVPVDADVDEAQDVGEEHRHQRQQRCEFRSMGHLHLQDDDRDDDGDHAITEGLDSVLVHACPLASSGKLPPDCTRNDGRHAKDSQENRQLVHHGIAGSVDANRQVQARSDEPQWNEHLGAGCEPGQTGTERISEEKAR